MPIYEFCCRDCGKVFEQLLLGNKVQIQCPDCHKTSVVKVMSACSIKSSATAPKASCSTPIT